MNECIKFYDLYGANSALTDSELLKDHVIVRGDCFHTILVEGYNRPTASVPFGADFPPAYDMSADEAENSVQAFRSYVSDLEDGLDPEECSYWESMDTEDPEEARKEMEALEFLAGHLRKVEAAQHRAYEAEKKEAHLRALNGELY